MLKWGQARIAFSALWPEIKDRLKSGETALQVFEALRDAGRITMSQSVFYRHLRQYLGRSAMPAPPPAVAPRSLAGARLSVPVTSPSAPALPGPAAPSPDRPEVQPTGPRAVQPDLRRLQAAPARDPWADDEDDDDSLTPPSEQH